MVRGRCFAAAATTSPACSCCCCYARPATTNGNTSLRYGQYIQGHNNDSPITLFAADLNNDGLSDAVVGWAGPGTIEWYENLGEQNWDEHAVFGAAGDLHQIIGADLDGDGDVDVVSVFTAGGGVDGVVAWHESSCGQAACGSVTWTYRDIVQYGTGWDLYPVVVAATDVDQDGDLDVVAGFVTDSANDGLLKWFKSDCGPTGCSGAGLGWTAASESAGYVPASLDIADMDGDGMPDLVTGMVDQAYANTAWFVNGGSAPTSAPTGKPTGIPSPAPTAEWWAGLCPDPGTRYSVDRSECVVCMAGQFSAASETVLQCDQCPEATPLTAAVGSTAAQHAAVQDCFAAPECSPGTAPAIPQLPYQTPALRLVGAATYELETRGHETITTGFPQIYNLGMWGHACIATSDVPTDWFAAFGADVCTEMGFEGFYGPHYAASLEEAAPLFAWLESGSPQISNLGLSDPQWLNTPGATCVDEWANSLPVGIACYGAPPPETFSRSCTTCPDHLASPGGSEPCTACVGADGPSSSDHVCSNSLAVCPAGSAAVQVGYLGTDLDRSDVGPAASAAAHPGPDGYDPSTTQPPAPAAWDVEIFDWYTGPASIVVAISSDGIAPVYLDPALASDLRVGIVVCNELGLGPPVNMVAEMGMPPDLGSGSRVSATCQGYETKLSDCAGVGILDVSVGFLTIECEAPGAGAEILECRTCADDYFRAQGTGEGCVQCSFGSSTSRDADLALQPAAHDSAGKCQYCEYGSYYDTEDEICATCAPNTFRSAASDSDATANLDIDGDGLADELGFYVQVYPGLGCALCPSGTHTVGTSRTSCVPCPPNHYLDDATNTCLKYQNVAISMVFGAGIGLAAFSLLLFCFCGGLLERTGRRGQQQVVNRYLERLQERHVKSIAELEEQKARTNEEKKTAPTGRPLQARSPAAQRLILAGELLLAAISLVFIFLAIYVVEIVRVMSNVYLIVSSMYLVGYLPDLRAEQISELLADSLRSALESCAPFLAWLGDVFEFAYRAFAAISLPKLFSVCFDAVQVTCDGTLAFGTLLADMLLFLFLCFIFLVELFPFVRVSVSALVSIEGARLKQRGVPLLVVLLFGASVSGVEACLRYVVQLTALGVTFSSIGVRGDAICDLQTGGVDTAMGVVAGIMTAAAMVCGAHLLLCVAIPGHPDGATRTWEETLRQKPSWLYAASAGNPPASSKVDADYFGKPAGDLEAAGGGRRESKVGALRAAKAMRRQSSSGPDKKAVSVSTRVPDACVLPFYQALSACVRGTGAAWSRGMYARLMIFRLRCMVKLTLGFWDEELCRAMAITERADHFDENPLDETPRDHEMVVSTGESHNMLWQLVPSLVILAKLGEAASKSPPWVRSNALPEHMRLRDIPPFFPRFEPGLTAKQKFAALKQSRAFGFLKNMLTYAFTVSISFAPSSAGPITGYLVVSFPFHLNDALEMFENMHVADLVHMEGAGFVFFERAAGGVSEGVGAAGAAAATAAAAAREVEVVNSRGAAGFELTPVAAG